MPEHEGFELIGIRLRTGLLDWVQSSDRRLSVISGGSRRWAASGHLTRLLGRQRSSSYPTVGIRRRPDLQALVPVGGNSGHQKSG